MSNKIVTVRVDAIREHQGIAQCGVKYDATNLTTGRKLTYRSAAKFRSEVIASESRSRIEIILKNLIAPKENQ